MPEQSAQEIWTRARAAHQAGRLDEAVELYALLTTVNPGSYAVQYNLGLALQELGRHTDAIQAYRRALQLNAALSEAHTNLANLFQGSGDAELAMAHYRAALASNPKLTLAALNLANLAFDLGRDMDALQNYVHVVRNDPSNEFAWSRLFSLAFALRQKRLAIQLFPQWASQPATLRQLAASLVVARLTGDAQSEQQTLSTLEHFPFERYTQQELFPILGNLPYFDASGDLRLAFYRRHAALFADVPQLCTPTRDRRQSAKIRIGYVSADFRRHVMGRIMRELIRHHDRQRFEIHLFSVCPPRFHDALTEDFRASVDSFTDLSDMADDVAAASIADKGIDILVDLLGHTQEAKSGIFARKPAPIQITHLGYHGCLGMGQVDYKVTDGVADTLDSVAAQIERPVFLDTCVMPFSTVSIPANAPTREELRNRFELDGKFAVGCFVNLMKLSPRCMRLWAKVSAACPQVQWVFSLYDKVDEVIATQLFARYGIASSRLTFLPTAADDGLQRARYRAIDLVLDTLPYAGGDTTIAALDMDVPVVTLKGHVHASRMGYSILWHLGLTEMVASDENAYVEISVRLIQDPALLAAKKEKVRTAKRVAPSARIDNHVRSLERAYRMVLEQ